MGAASETIDRRLIMPMMDATPHHHMGATLRMNALLSSPGHPRVTTRQSEVWHHSSLSRMGGTLLAQLQSTTVNIMVG
jgi:hypothetical protein